MDSRDKWNIIHEYRAYVAQDVLPPIKCPECEYEMVPVVDTNDDPALQCMSCMITTHPGSFVYDAMARNIKELKEEIARNRIT